MPCTPEGLPSLLPKLNTNTPLRALSDPSLVLIKPCPTLCLHPGILQTSSCPAASGTSGAWTCAPELSPPVASGGCLLCSESALFKCSWCSLLGDVDIKQLCRAPRFEHLCAELVVNLSTVFSLVLSHTCSTYL